MTSAWLELLLQRKEFHHSIVFVVEEILPSYQNWRFNNPIEKETFGQKVLKVCSRYDLTRQNVRISTSRLKSTILRRVQIRTTFFSSNFKLQS